MSYQNALSGSLSFAVEGADSSFGAIGVSGAVVLQEIMTRGVGLVASMSVALGLSAVVALTKSLAEHSPHLDRCGL